MNNDTSGVWRFTSSKDALPDLLADLQTQSIIFPFELDYLLQQINKMVDTSTNDTACFISGMHKDVVLLPSSSGKDEFDIVINRNHEKLDHVTLLPSKYALQRQLDKWIRKDSPEEIIALFIIELNEFSKVNDVIEHAAGDLLLFQLARRLEKLNTFDQKVVRLHGDEFGILVKGFDDLEHIWQVAEWIEKQFELPFEVENNTIYLNPSIGISAIPHAAKNHAELLKTAYFAVNKSKQDTSQVSHFYEAKYAQKLERNLLVESELNTCLRAKQGLEAYYQPKQTLSSNAIDGVEALIRWNHPTDGIVSPGQFIPVAEQSDLICDLTDHIINQVCIDIPVFRANGFTGPVSINISARDFARKDFVTDVCAILELNNVQPADIELEITEGAFISDFNHCCLVLNALRDKGFSISIDDFGTGYSSLSYLRKLPIDVLKIDMSFVRDIEKSNKIRQIYAALIQIADAIDLKVVAEGVDNPLQKEVLKEIGCDLIQGYLLSKPVPLAQFCELFLSKEV